RCASPARFTELAARSTRWRLFDGVAAEFHLDRAGAQRAAGRLAQLDRGGGSGIVVVPPAIAGAVGRIPHEGLWHPRGRTGSVRDVADVHLRGINWVRARRCPRNREVTRDRRAADLLERVAELSGYVTARVDQECVIGPAGASHQV